MRLFRAILTFVGAVVIFVPLVVFTFLFNIPRKLILGEDLTEHFFVAAIGVDQLAGSTMYTKQDFTVSSWTYYLHNKGGNKWATWFMRFIDFGAMVLAGQKEHCKKSYENELRELSEGGR